MPLFIVAYRPSGVPADLKSAVKKVRPIKTGGFAIPQQKERHNPLLRIANPQSLKRLGHFLTPDCKSGGTPGGLAFDDRRKIERRRCIKSPRHTLNHLTPTSQEVSRRFRLNHPAEPSLPSSPVLSCRTTGR